MIQRVEMCLRGLRRALGRTSLTRRLFAHAHPHAHAHRVGSVDHDGERHGLNRHHSRGLVVVQIDGLSLHEFERALARGTMPMLMRLQAHEGYRLHRLYSGLPSSTPAVQGELFYGVAGAVPAFAWRERDSGELRRMYDPASAKRVERDLLRQGEPLLAGGSAYCDIYTGGATEAHFCAASLGWSDVLQGARPHAWFGVAVLHLPTLIRTASLAALESLLAIVDALRGILHGHRAWPELKFVAARVAVVVLLRDLITIGAKVDIDRGLPIVHLNFIGYDEQAHRRGPETAFAHRALRGIDRRIAALWQALHLAEHRHYDLWIYGDHGQTHAEPYHRHTGRTIEAAVEVAVEVAVEEAVDEAVEAAAHADRRTEAGECADGASRGVTGGLASGVTKGVSNGVARAGGVPSRAHLLGGRHLPSLFPEAPPPMPAKLDGLRSTVVGLGPVAHVLLGSNLPNNSKTLERLASWLVGPGDVPAVLFVTTGGEVKARIREALLTLPESAGRLLGESHPALPDVVTDLMALARHRDAGDLILLGWAYGCRSLSFAEENGAHAGVAPAETLSFALLPEDALGERDRVNTTPLRPLDLRQAVWQVLGDPATTKVESNDLANANVDTAPVESDNGATPPGAATSQIVHLSSALSASTGIERERRLRVMSYNVHGCVGMDGRLAPERVARVIARQAPDVVALQELDVGRSRSGRRDQAAVIAALLEMDHRFHAAIHVEEEAYGNAILTRLPVLAHREGLLPVPRGGFGIEPRGVLWITLELDGMAVQVLNTHFGLSPAARRVQVAELLSDRWLAHPDCRGSTILCGDLNASPRSAPVQRLRESLVDVREIMTSGGRRPTFPARFPMFAIDHVLTRDVHAVDCVTVPKSALERLASDHLPLIVDLRLEPVAHVRDSLATHTGVHYGSDKK